MALGDPPSTLGMCKYECLTVYTPSQDVWHPVSKLHSVWGMHVYATQIVFRE